VSAWGAVLLGVSRKSVIGALTGRTDPADRLGGSLAAAAVAWAAGVEVIRTHDVAETIDLITVLEAVKSPGGEDPTVYRRGADFSAQCN